MMFESLKGMAAAAGLMRDMPRVKAALEQTRRRLEDMDVAATSGGGAVRVVATASMRIRSVTIDHAMLSGIMAGDPANRSLAESLIAEATNAALLMARETAGREIARAANDLGIDLPPGMLNSLLT